ncbi:MAG: hypothetical protein HY870_15385 [Chloroflexi bacterium]|nr:hypothetical protein [Chloroflexota bacterium]
MFQKSRFIAIVAGVIGLVMIAGACQSAAKPPEVTITAKEYAFEMPESIAGGVVTLKLSNAGKEAHMAMLFRLNDGVTLDQFNAALKEPNPSGVFALGNLASGVNTTPPGATQATTLDLKAGDYAVLDFGAGEDHVPYMAKGMLKPFKVTAGSSTAEPASDVAVTMKEFAFEMPTELKAGAHTFKVSNQGAQSHEMILFRLAEGRTLADMQAFLSNPESGGPPPGEQAGGALPMAAGMRAWATVDLKAGSYVAVCFVPDSGDGKSHLEHGMLMPLTVN